MNKSDITNAYNCETPVKKKPTKQGDYFYIGKEFLIAEKSVVSKSKRTFDIPLFDLANNEKLLNALNLYHIQGNGVVYTKETRSDWFAGYLSSFNSSDLEKASRIIEKMKSNPVVRILITDKALLPKVKELLP